MSFDRKSITTSKKTLGTGSESFLLGFNRYKLAEREYIIFYPKNYNLFLRTYANSFAKGMRTSNVKGGSQGATLRYLNKATGLTKIQQIATTGGALLKSNEELTQNFGEQVMRAWAAAAGDGMLDAINSYSNQNRTQIQTARKKLAKNVTTTIFDIKNLGKFFVAYWSILTQAEASPRAGRAFARMVKTWGKAQGTAHVAPDVQGLSKQDMEYLNQAAGFLNSITNEYNKLLGSIKTYKVGNKEKGIKKGDTIIRDSHQASVDLVGYIQSLLSNMGGDSGEEAAVKLLDAIIFNQLPYKLSEIVDKAGKIASTGGIITIKPAESGSTKKIGTQKNAYQKTAKTDVVTPWLSITSSMADGTSVSYQTKIAANVKSYPSLVGMTYKDTVDYGSTSKGKMIKIQEVDDIYPYLKHFSPATARFYMENALVHAASASEPMRLTKQTIAANFFDEWLAGTATRVSKSGEIDLSNFMIVNNHIFSMYDIIQEVASSFNENSLSSAINVSITGRSNIKNKWVKGENGEHSYAQGFTRSATVLGELSQIGLIAKMNPRVLFNVAAKYGIKPIL